MWNVKTKAIPVIIGATEAISKSLAHYLSSIPGKHEIEELQKVAIFSAAHILKKITDVKVQHILRAKLHYM